MIIRECPQCKMEMQDLHCRICNHMTTVIESNIYWCDSCNIPLYNTACSCGTTVKRIATDIRPVFPEENLLISLILKGEPWYYREASMWCAGNTYIIDGKKHKLPVSQINKWPIEKIKALKDEYDKYSPSIDYKYFNEYIKRFVDENQIRYNEIVEKASNLIQMYKGRYQLDEMMVSFSGGKDSTVVSHLVTEALGTKGILHIFGDTTLEFPYTMDYKKRIKNKDGFKGIRILSAKNREKNFEDLCEVIGPPSRVMRWCCTVFKTGAIQRTIFSAFKNQKNILSFQGIRHSESASRSKYERESESPKITKQTVMSPIIDWMDFDVWLYLLTPVKPKDGAPYCIDFNDAYKLGWTRVGCWCCPNNGGWSEFLSKVHMHEQYLHWNQLLVDFAKKIGKPDPEDYVSEGGWKARQGGNGLAAAQTAIVTFEPCATEENAFNYELQRPITEELYELFKPFGYINTELGNKRLGEVYVLNKKGEVVLVLQGRIGSTKLKVTIKDFRIASAKNISVAEGKIQCQLTKYQMCICCKACESICKHDAISVKDDGKGNINYYISNEKCVRCAECVGHFDSGCYMRKVLGIKRS